MRAILPAGEERATRKPSGPPGLERRMHRHSREVDSTLTQRQAVNSTHDCARRPIHELHDTLGLEQQHTPIQFLQRCEGRRARYL
jgi:hypothetical protein